jgi:thioredoxin-dependent peroxiredoxin
MAAPTTTDFPGPGDRAPDASLVNLDGLLEMLSTAWRERPAAVVFLRYFGCPICRQQVLRMRNDREQFERAGMEVVLVGHGGPEDARRFVEARPVPFRVLVDPSRAAYERYGLKRGSISQVFGPQCVAPMVKAALQPQCRQGLPNGGNVMQMPGAFVVDTSGVVLLAHRSATIGDTPTTAQLLSALGDQRRAA